MVALRPSSTKAALQVSEPEEVCRAVKLSTPRNDKPRFEIPGRHSIVVASAIFALLILAGVLSRRPVPLSPQPTLPPIPPSAPAQPAPTVSPKPQPPEDLPNPGCVIKGNISKTGERIYHLPGQDFYEKTVISPEKGERWFCTEEEARAAGWRKSRR